MSRIVEQDEWLKARLELMQAEKALTRLRDEVAAARRGLPWVQVSKDYRFTGESGELSLADMFGRRGQLIIYHFMLAPGAKAPCKMCSFWAEEFDAVRAHIGARDVEFAVVSRAPLNEIQQVRQRMGWRFPWYSSFGSDFNADFGVSFTPEQAGQKLYNFGTQAAKPGEMPGLSVFARDAAGAVFHTYSAYSRGLDAINATYQMLDLVPAGRDEAGLAFSMSWLRYKGEYDVAE